MDVINNQLAQIHNWDVNEATAASQRIVPVLTTLFGDLELVAEFNLSFRFTTNKVTLDTRTTSQLDGRADFFLRDPKSGKMLVVIEAKRPGHPLTKDDEEQVRTYMRCVLPVVPFGILVNSNEPTRLFAWKDGDIEQVDESDSNPVSAVPTGLDESMTRLAIGYLLRATPAFRDSIVTQASRRALPPPSRAARTVVSVLHSRHLGCRSAVSVVTAPPMCGKSQVLVDLAHISEDSTLLYLGGNYHEMLELLFEFDLKEHSELSPLLRFLSARKSASTILVLVDVAEEVTEFLRQLLTFCACEDKVDLVVAASFQHAQSLLFRPNRSPTVDDGSRLTVFELGALDDDELFRIHPMLDRTLASQPFARLARWPGICWAFDGATRFDRSLAQWFRMCPPEVQRALHILGSTLVSDPEWTATRVPASFVARHANELSDLVRCGLITSISHPITGIPNYSLSCIEVGLYAMLHHAFTDQPNIRALDGVIAYWRRATSEHELAALIACLPAFLTQESGRPLDRILRRMLAISLGSSVLEAVSRSDLFQEYSREFETYATIPSRPMLNRSAVALRRALVALRQASGMLPNFAELEQALGESIRGFDSDFNAALQSGLSIVEWQNPEIVRRLAKHDLVDVLYVLSRGDTSWISGPLDTESLVAIAKCVASVVADRSSSFPISSQITELNHIITRDEPRDLPLLLRQHSGANGPIPMTPHTGFLVDRVIELYQSGSWHVLADSFAYYHWMPNEIRERFALALAMTGPSDSFAHVLVNSVLDSLLDWTDEQRAPVLRRLEATGEHHSWVVSNARLELLSFVKNSEAGLYAALEKSCWDSGDPVAISRLLRVHIVPPLLHEQSEALARLVSMLDIRGMCRAVSTPEFVDELRDVIALPICDIESFLTEHGSGAGFVSLTQILCLLNREGQSMVTDPGWYPKAFLFPLDVRSIVLALIRPDRANLRWEVGRVRHCIGFAVQSWLAVGESQLLDELLRTALLSIHHSRFNAIFVRVAIDTGIVAGAKYRFALFRRLILSGFDLWEVPCSEFCPMLSELLESVVVAMDETEVDGVVSWMHGHYGRLRRVQLFAHYTLRELVRCTRFWSQFWDHTLDSLTPERETSVLPLVDSLRYMVPENRPELAGAVLHALRIKEGILQAFERHYPDELATLRALVDPAPEQPERVFDDEELIERFREIAGQLPTLPLEAPAWTDRSPPRSMLAPLPGGYRQMSAEQFRTSFLE